MAIYKKNFNTNNCWFKPQKRSNNEPPQGKCNVKCIEFLWFSMCLLILSLHCSIIVEYCLLSLFLFAQVLVGKVLKFKYCKSKLGDLPVKYYNVLFYYIKGSRQLAKMPKIPWKTKQNMTLVFLVVATALTLSHFCLQFNRVEKATPCECCNPSEENGSVWVSCSNRLVQRSHMFVAHQHCVTLLMQLLHHTKWTHTSRSNTNTWLIAQVGLIWCLIWSYGP